MAVKRKAEALSKSDEPSLVKSTQTSSHAPKYEPTDEFQQVTLGSFVEPYRIHGMGYGADVYYQPDFIEPATADKWYTELLALDTWCERHALCDKATGPDGTALDHPTLKMYGKSFPQSRSIAAYSTTPGATLNYSGTSITMNHPFPPVLESMRERLEQHLGVKFNHVMLNRYDDGSVYIGRHSDNLNNLVIASISLGAKRTFIMSPRLPNRAGRNRGSGLSDIDELSLQSRENKKWTLNNGSLVVMQGRTQEFWKHEIPKEPKIKTGRISLTFRQLV
ncbi:hypothetical protein BD324DRAFT_651303 [Kockovaella imperatae]|uniref:Fe2OG dioxygenase domain-containing protein n=1 Tax=Kockovaella imperatae TaxID=4999 RepID=A0A1Y1UFN3_9TREE|nr:hypothetical protein BD324DRAFT_651303 [Kockovaella imperatae]ORX36822.1 hypothetical protein BD324DRAFT_651303 [Kockovaella imperatae]